MKKQTTPKPDAIHAHVLPGPSNEEIAAREAEKAKQDPFYGRVEIGADARDKQIDGWGDTDYDPLGLTDPLAQLKRDHQKPGMALKLLSPDVMNRMGSRGYQIVRDANGDAVSCGKMVLGEIPERIAQQRRRAVAQLTREELSSITDSQREKVDRLKTEARDMGLTVLESGDRVKNVGDGQIYDMGVTVDRGN